MALTTFLSLLIPMNLTTKLGNRRMLCAFVIASTFHLPVGYAGGTSPAHKTSTAAGLASMSLEDLLRMRVVTTASRIPQRVSDAPSAVVVLTAADIQTYGWDTLGDALATLPGLYTTYDRSYAYLGSRGFLRVGDYGSRFLLLIDGHRANDPIYDQAAIGSEFMLDMDLIERIEYSPGPGSAVYGANALFGTINVITKKGRDFDGVEAAASVGSFGNKKARITYGRQGKGRNDFLISATTHERSGRDLYFSDFDTPDQNYGVANGLDYERGLKLLLKGTYEDFSFSLSHATRKKGVPTAAYDTVFNEPYFTEDKQTLASVKYSRALTSSVAIDGHVFAGRYDYKAESVPAWSAPQKNTDGSHANWYGLDLHATLTNFDRHKIVVGTHVQHDARKDQYNYSIEPYWSELDDHRTGSHAGFYVEDEITLPYNFVLNAGVRYDTLSDGKHSVSPRIALIHKLNRTTTIKAIYGTAFRSPNAYETYYAYSGEGGQEPNLDLQPERITTHQLVLDQALGNATHATLSIFQYKIDDLISMTVNPETGLYVHKNMDRADGRGAELNIEHKWREGAQLRASYSWQLARDGMTNAVLDNSPRSMAKLNVAIPLFDNAVRLGTEIRYISARRTAMDNVPSYYVANLTVNLPKLIAHGNISFSAYNLFDRRYADPAGPGLVQDSIRQDGRTFLLKFTYEL